MSKKLNKVDSTRLLELELIAEYDLAKLNKSQWHEWLSIWVKYLDKPGYNWVRKELSHKLHDLGDIYYEISPRLLRKI